MIGSVWGRMDWCFNEWACPFCGTVVDVGLPAFDVHFILACEIILTTMSDVKCI